MLNVVQRKSTREKRFSPLLKIVSVYTILTKNDRSSII